MEQNYDNHKRFVPGFHYLLGSFLLIGTIASIVNAVFQLLAHDNGFSAILIVLLFICCILLFWFTRGFAVTVQNRAIRAEETLRYYILTGKTIDARLTMGQIIALRFAYDSEFLVLAETGNKRKPIAG